MQINYSISKIGKPYVIRKPQNLIQASGFQKKNIARTRFEPHLLQAMNDACRTQDESDI